jgi:hypothetical protein
MFIININLNRGGPGGPLVDDENRQKCFPIFFKNGALLFPIYITVQVVG